MEIMKKVGESIKLARMERNKTVYDIEKEVGLSHQSQYKWESGETEPSIVSCIKLAEYYGITLDELVGK